MAPEITCGSLLGRGRAVDIFCLGAIFLEIATIICAPPGSLKRFAEFRETGEPEFRTRAYSRCPLKIVNWIWHLWGCCDQYGLLKRRKKAAYDDFVEHGAAIYDLAFLMLDPEPKTRITARQLVAMIDATSLYYRGGIKYKACDNCRQAPDVAHQNLPLHSTYKDTDSLDHPDSPEAALTTEIATNWEDVKVLWLQHHMWWDPPQVLR